MRDSNIAYLITRDAEPINPHERYE